MMTKTMKTKTKTAFLDQEKQKKRAKTKKDTCTSYQNYLHWQKSRPNAHLYHHQKFIFETILRTKWLLARYINSQEIPGLCLLLTIISMGGMMGSENMHLEKDFTLLWWLCISINDTLFIPQYTSTCIDILEERFKRFM